MQGHSCTPRHLAMAIKGGKESCLPNWDRQWATKLSTVTASCADSCKQTSEITRLLCFESSCLYACAVCVYIYIYLRVYIIYIYICIHIYVCIKATGHLYIYIYVYMYALVFQFVKGRQMQNIGRREVTESEKGLSLLSTTHAAQQQYG